MTLLWWHWLALGLILVALEMAASGGFYVIFFGAAALAIGALHALDLAGPAWLQLLLFSVLSIGSLALFRSPLMRWMQLDGPGRDRNPHHRVVRPQCKTVHPAVADVRPRPQQRREGARAGDQPTAGDTDQAYHQHVARTREQS